MGMGHGRRGGGVMCLKKAAQSSQVRSEAAKALQDNEWILLEAAL
jgi:hypothetical protein